MEILQLTNGTTTIDLIDETVSGIKHLDWTPAQSSWKGGGIFQDSPLSDGRELKFRRFNNITESIPFAVFGSSQDDVISKYNEFLKALESASTYWINPGTSDPFYIVAKADNETDARYALIYSYSIGDLPYIFDGPFEIGGNIGSINYDTVLGPIDFTLEHGAWGDTIPGVATQIEINNKSDYKVLDSWSLDSSTPSGQIYCFLETSTGDLYAGGTGEILIDTGSGWSVDTSIPTGTVLSMIEASDGSIYATDTARVLKKPSLGAWSVNNTFADATGVLNCIIQANNDDIFVGGVEITTNYGKFWYTNDNGSSWSAGFNTASTSQVPKDMFYDSGLGMIFTTVTSGLNFFLASYDDGATWEVIFSGLYLSNNLEIQSSGYYLSTSGTNLVTNFNRKEYPYFAQSVLVASAFSGTPTSFVYDSTNDIYYAGLNGTIESSENSYDAWGTETTLPSGQIEALYISSTGDLYAGDTGSILKKSYSLNTLEYGFESSTVGVPVANYQKFIQPSFMKIYDASTTTYTDITLPITTSTELLPNPMATGDYLYIGFDDDVYDNINIDGFCIVLDESATIDGGSGLTFDWRMDFYQTGAWVIGSSGVIPMTRGQNIVVHQNTEVVTVDGQSGYWYRIHTLSGGSTYSSALPPITSITPYVINPFIEYDDVSSITDGSGMIQLDNARDASSEWLNGVIIAQRGLSRGVDFTPFFNASDNVVENIRGVGVAVGANSAFADITVASSNRRVVDYSPAGVEALADRVVFTVPKSLASQYSGKFRVFVRTQFAAALPDGPYPVRLRFSAGGSQDTYTDTKYVNVGYQAQSPHADYLGELDIPLSNTGTNNSLDNIELAVQMGCDDATSPHVVSIQDIILMPADEWLGDFRDIKDVDSQDAVLGFNDNRNATLFIDSITMKGQLSVLLKDTATSDNSVIAPYSEDANTFTINSSGAYRLWFLIFSNIYQGQADPTWANPQLATLFVKLFVNRNTAGF